MNLESSSMKQEDLFIGGTVGGDGLYTEWSGTVYGQLDLQWNGWDKYESGQGQFTMDSDWDPERGLIYTDKTFIKTLREELSEKGFKHIKGIGYSEQGRQECNLVDFDVSKELLLEAQELGYHVWVEVPDDY